MPIWAAPKHQPQTMFGAGVRVRVGRGNGWEREAKRFFLQYLLRDLILEGVVSVGSVFIWLPLVDRGTESIGLIYD